MRKPMKHPKRPRDPNQLAKAIIDIATGATADTPSTPAKSRADAAELGGKARAAKLTPRSRTEIASKAARKRWGVKSES